MYIYISGLTSVHRPPSTDPNPSWYLRAPSPLLPCIQLGL